MSSQKEIARKLNLSQATVSRALRNDQRLPLRTRVKVKQTALELGYEVREQKQTETQEEPARTLRRILVLVHLDGRTFEQSSFWIELLQGLEEAAKLTGVTLIRKEIYDEKEARQVIGEYSNSVIGAVTIFRFPDAIMGLLNAAFPCVSFNHHYPDQEVKVVEAAQEKAFQQLYDYLYAQGLRRIGFLTVRNSQPFALTRYAGFLQALQRHGGIYNPDWFLNIDPRRQFAEPELVRQVVELFRRDGVEGVICTSGGFAISLIEQLAGCGVRVPEDVSVAAFDDIRSAMPDGRLVCGALSNYKRMAETAIRILCNPGMFDAVCQIGCPAAFVPGDTVRKQS